LKGDNSTALEKQIDGRTRSADLFRNFSGTAKVGGNEFFQSKLPEYEINLSRCVGGLPSKKDGLKPAIEAPMFAAPDLSAAQSGSREADRTRNNGIFRE
jgi:hypothetical protein